MTRFSKLVTQGLLTLGLVTRLAKGLLLDTLVFLVPVILLAKVLLVLVILLAKVFLVLVILLAKVLLPDTPCLTIPAQVILLAKWHLPLGGTLGLDTPPARAQVNLPRLLCRM